MKYALPLFGILVFMGCAGNPFSFSSEETVLLTLIQGGPVESVLYNSDGEIIAIKTNVLGKHGHAIEIGWAGDEHEVSLEGYGLALALSGAAGYRTDCVNPELGKLCVTK